MSLDGLDIYPVKDEPFEYFCKKCYQLRLNLNGRKICGNCGSAEIVIGKVGELDKEALIVACEQEEDDGLTY